MSETLRAPDAAGAENGGELTPPPGPVMDRIEPCTCEEADRCRSPPPPPPPLLELEPPFELSDRRSDFMVGGSG